MREWVPSTSDFAGDVRASISTRSARAKELRQSLGYHPRSGSASSPWAARRGQAPDRRIPAGRGRSAAPGCPRLRMVLVAGRAIDPLCSSAPAVTRSRCTHSCPDIESPIIAACDRFPCRRRLTTCMESLARGPPVSLLPLRGNHLRAELHVAHRLDPLRRGPRRNFVTRRRR